MIPLIDRFLNITISKKLTVFLIATIFLYFGKIDSEQWLVISSVYVGVQSFIDGIKEYYNSKK